MEITSFIYICLACWRLSSLFANESGPFSMFERLRNYASHLQETNIFWKSFKLHDGLECEWCNSIWFAVPIIALYVVFGDVIVIVLLPLSISTVVIFFKYSLEAIR